MRNLLLVALLLFTNISFGQSETTITTIDFIKMNSTLNKNVIQDFKNNTIAIWHDESHLNKYLLNVPCKRLHSGYAHPSVYDNILNKNIVKLLHKNSNGII